MFGEGFQIIGHRGWKAKYPENTMLGFEKAIEAGATMIEFDVQLTMDNQLAIFHDETAKRLCDRYTNITASLKDTIKKELRVEGNEIPFLDELFDTFKDDTKYYIELKTYDSCTQEQRTKLAFYTINEITKHNLRPNCFIVSFDPKILQLCRRLGYNNLGMNVSGEKKPFFCKLACRNNKNINKEVSEPTFAWTVNNAKRMKTLMKYKVDGIVTDHVDKLVKICKDDKQLTHS